MFDGSVLQGGGARSRFVVVVCSALALCLGGLAQAQAATPVTFVAVDAVEVDPLNMIVTGVLEGQSTPMTLTFYFYNSSSSYGPHQRAGCERAALLLMEKPGKYTLRINTASYGYPKCRLALVKP